MIIEYFNEVVGETLDKIKKKNSRKLRCGNQNESDGKTVEFTKQHDNFFDKQLIFF